MGLGGSVLPRLPETTARPNTNAMPTSHGEQLLAAMLARIIIGQPERNARTPWLHGLELDFWYPAHRLAFEFQGGQHFMAVYGQAQLRRTRANDGRKRRICRDRGIVLIRVDAADLAYPRLVRLIRHWFAFSKRRKDLPTVARFGREVRQECSQAGEMAVGYRQTLTSRFACPTAHRKGSQTRRRAQSEWSRSTQN